MSYSTTFLMIKYSGQTIFNCRNDRLPGWTSGLVATALH